MKCTSGNQHFTSEANNFVYCKWLEIFKQQFFKDWGVSYGQTAFFFFYIGSGKRVWNSSQAPLVFNTSQHVDLLMSPTHKFIVMCALILYIQSYYFAESKLYLMIQYLFGAKWLKSHSLDG